MDNITNYHQNKSLGWYLTKVSRIIVRLYNEELRALDISSSQSGVLFALYEAKQKKEILSQNDLSNILFLNKVSTHKLLVGLEKKQLITRKIDPSHQRRKIVSLTPKGLTLITPTKKIDKKLDKEINAALIDAQSSKEHNASNIQHFQHALITLLSLKSKKTHGKG